jgi:2'-5' RNA ligase
MTYPGASVRLFFAVVPDRATQQRLAAAAASLALGAEARLVPRNNYHATLAFVGGIPERQLDIVRRIGAAQAAAAFSLRFDAFEYWPKPEVVVAAARAIPAALEQLWQQLHRGLAEHRWALDPKRLRPHVTLAKRVSQAPALQAMSCEWRARDFCLLRSDAGATDPAYTVVDTWPLLDGGEET